MTLEIKEHQGSVSADDTLEIVGPMGAVVLPRAEAENKLRSNPETWRECGAVKPAPKAAPEPEALPNFGQPDETDSAD